MLEELGPLEVPLKVADIIAYPWVKLTYNTPISQIPVIGLKSSLNPLGSFWRERYGLVVKEDEWDKGLPMPPQEGPPLPRIVKQKWPWKK